MNVSSARQIEDWEDDGGAAFVSLDGFAGSTKGSVAQVEWADRIKRDVNAEFDRVAASFRSIAAKQGDDKRTETEAIIAILEDKRAE